jgi:16S rRNA (cytidine1402-2'-O)-methyltransferase
MVLLIGPPTGEIAGAQEANRSVRQDVEELMRVESVDRKAALKRVARARGVSKSQAYRLMLDERDESE